MSVKGSGFIGLSEHFHGWIFKAIIETLQVENRTLDTTLRIYI